MSKFSKSLIVSSVLAASAMASGAASADVSANIGVTSNYMWRGVTQSANEAAISGGLDYSHESGFYAGTWTSSLYDDFSAPGPQYEHDLYAGYGGEAGGFSYDVSYTMYMYPIGEDVELDFSEVGISVGYGPLTLFAAQTVGTEDSDAEKDGTYMSLNLSGDINKDFGYSLTYGSYTGDDIEAVFGDTYTHYAVAVSKGDFTFAYEKNDIDNTTMVDNDPKVVASWGKEL